jgi:hypothetical protein
VKGDLIDLKVERERRQKPNVEVELEATVERGKVRVTIFAAGARITGLLAPEHAHELGGLLQRTSMRVAPRRR